MIIHLRSQASAAAPFTARLQHTLFLITLFAIALLCSACNQRQENAAPIPAAEGAGHQIDIISPPRHEDTRTTTSEPDPAAASSTEAVDTGMGDNPTTTAI